MSRWYARENRAIPHEDTMSNNLQRIGDGTVQIWRALPPWGKVVTAIVAVIGLYYSFALILGLFFMAAFAVGFFTLVSWLMRR
jgi:hypothetical protein